MAWYVVQRFIIRARPPAAPRHNAPASHPKTHPALFVPQASLNPARLAQYLFDLPSQNPLNEEFPGCVLCAHGGVPAILPNPPERFVDVRRGA